MSEIVGNEVAGKPEQIEVVGKPEQIEMEDVDKYEETNEHWAWQEGNLKMQMMKSKIRLFYFIN